MTLKFPLRQGNVSTCPLIPFQGLHGSRLLKHDSLCPTVPSILPLPLQNKRANKNRTALLRQHTLLALTLVAGRRGCSCWSLALLMVLCRALRVVALDKQDNLTHPEVTGFSVLRTIRIW